MGRELEGGTMVRVLVWLVAGGRIEAEEKEVVLLGGRAAVGSKARERVSVAAKASYTTVSCPWPSVQHASSLAEQQ
jgi:hypothetical protein